MEERITQDDAENIIVRIFVGRRVHASVPLELILRGVSTDANGRMANIQQTEPDLHVQRPTSPANPGAFTAGTRTTRPALPTSSRTTRSQSIQANVAGSRQRQAAVGASNMQHTDQVQVTPASSDRATNSGSVNNPSLGAPSQLQDNSSSNDGTAQQMVRSNQSPLLPLGQTSNAALIDELQARINRAQVDISNPVVLSLIGQSHLRDLISALQQILESGIEDELDVTILDLYRTLRGWMKDKAPKHNEGLRSSVRGGKRRIKDRFGGTAESLPGSSGSSEVDQTQPREVKRARSSLRVSYNRGTEHGQVQVGRNEIYRELDDVDTYEEANDEDEEPSNSVAALVDMSGADQAAAGRASVNFGSEERVLNANTKADAFKSGSLDDGAGYAQPGHSKNREKVLEISTPGKIPRLLSKSQKSEGHDDNNTWNSDDDPAEHDPDIAPEVNTSRRRRQRSHWEYEDDRDAEKTVGTDDPDLVKRKNRAWKEGNIPEFNRLEAQIAALSATGTRSTRSSRRVTPSDVDRTRNLSIESSNSGTTGTGFRSNVNALANREAYSGRKPPASAAQEERVHGRRQRSRSSRAMLPPSVPGTNNSPSRNLGNRHSFLSDRHVGGPNSQTNVDVIPMMPRNSSEDNVPQFKNSNQRKGTVMKQPASKGQKTRANVFVPRATRKSQCITSTIEDDEPAAQDGLQDGIDDRGGLLSDKQNDVLPAPHDESLDEESHNSESDRRKLEAAEDVVISAARLIEHLQ